MRDVGRYVVIHLKKHKPTGHLHHDAVDVGEECREMICHPAKEA
jgi:hypothetical protein